MPGPQGIRSIITDWDDVNDVLREWKEAIEAGRNITFGPGFNTDKRPSGMTVSLALPSFFLYAKTTSGGITAASGTTLGEGDVILQGRAGGTLTDGVTIKCYSNFSTAVTHPSRLLVGQDGSQVTLIGADCPP